MRKYRPIKKAKEGESVRFGSGLSIGSGQRSSGYTTPDIMGGGMFSDPLKGFKSYSSSRASGTTAGGTASTGTPSDAEELGVMMGSAERPELLLRQESDRTRDRIARRTYRAMKRGDTYDASQDMSMKGRRDQRKADRLQKRIDKTTEAMDQSSQEAAQLQGARESQNQLRRDAAEAEYEYDKAAYDKARAAQGPGSMGMGDSKDPSNLVPTGPSGSSLTAPIKRQVTDDEASREETKAFKRAEKLDKKREKLLEKQGKIDTPESMQTKLDEAYRKEDAKELMRKKQGRYGWPYTEDTNLLPEHKEALRQQRLGQNIRGTYSYSNYTPTGQIKAELYPTGSSSATPILTSQTASGQGSTAFERLMGRKMMVPQTLSGESGLKIKKKRYRAIR
jgi:hypothetical protein